MEPKYLIEVKIRVNDTKYLINQCLKRPSKKQLRMLTFELYFGILHACVSLLDYVVSSNAYQDAYTSAAHITSTKVVMKQQDLCRKQRDISNRA